MKNILGDGYTSHSFRQGLISEMGAKGINAKIISKFIGHSDVGIHPLTFIAQVNQVMKNILGDGYTSHSFRQGLISEMGAKGINAKIISKFIGHSDVKTTMGYIKPTDDDVKGAMIR